MEEQNEEIKTDTDELEKCKQQCEEYLNNWKRERADFLNYKKDETRRIEEFLKFGTEGLIAELIDVIDGVEVARKNLPRTKELKDWTDGFDSSMDKLHKFLGKFGVERIRVEGDPSTGSTSSQQAGSGQAETDPAKLEELIKLTDEEVVEVLSFEVKKRKDSIEQYEKGGRPELAQKEQEEIKILMGYMPEQMSEEAIRDEVKKTVNQTGASGPRDMGKVIGAVMAKVKGKADGQVVSRIVKEELQKSA